MGEVMGIHHVGITVDDLEATVRFWEVFLGKPVRNRRLRDAPYVSAIVGIDGLQIETCWVDLPGGDTLELLHYIQDTLAPYDPQPNHPGHVHLCLDVTDIDALFRRATQLGAQPVSKTPVTIADGPTIGTQVAYIRTPPGLTLELRQAPSSG